MSPFLNFHRPCHFPVETVDDDGRTTKRYPYDNVATPYEKLNAARAELPQPAFRLIFVWD